MLKIQKKNEINENELAGVEIESNNNQQETGVEIKEVINEERELENSTAVQNSNREVGGGFADRIKYTGRARLQTTPFRYIAPGQPKIDQVFVPTKSSAI